MYLAASMSSRGFGRSSQSSIAANRLLKASSLGAAAFTIIATYLILTLGLFNGMSIVTLILSLVSSVVAIKISSRQKIRTFLNRKKFGALDAFVLFSGLAIFYAVSRGWIA